MNGSVVNIGIIGACGGRMNFSHLPNLHSNPRARFRAFCDLDAAKAERIARERGYEVGYFTADADELMRDPEIGLLVCGLPHEIHESMILRACAARKDIFIEKPMTLGLRECENVLKSVRESGIRLMVGHNRRFAPTFTDAKHIYTEKMHRKPAVVTCRIADPQTTLFDEDPECGGRIYGEQCHFFDLLSWFLDSEPLKIYTCGDINCHIITIAFENGSSGCLIAGSRGGMGFPKEQFECFADSQSVIVEGNMCLTHSGACGQVTVTNYPLFCDPYPGLPGTLEGYRQRMTNYAKDEYEGKFKVFSHPSGYKGHYEELDECISAILEGRPFSAGETDGARAVVCCAAAVESVRTGLPVKVDRTLYMLTGGGPPSGAS